MNGREELDHGKHTFPTQQTYYEAGGLIPNMEYQFWVSASTRVGEGKSSKVVSLSTSSRVSAKIISFGMTVIRPWKSTVQFQCISVGQPRRDWFKNDISMNTFFNGQILDSGELSLYNIQSSDSGNYTLVYKFKMIRVKLFLKLLLTGFSLQHFIQRCQVDNGIGSDRIIYSLIVQLPPLQPMLYVTSATSTSILMHWKNTGNGNAPITSYTLHYKKSNGNTEELSLSKHANSFELKGLTCGSTYNIYLTAHNKIGSSSPSTSLHVRTQGEN